MSVSGDGQRRILIAPATVTLSNERYGKTYNLLNGLRDDDTKINLWVDQVDTTIDAPNISVHACDTGSKQRYYLRSFREAYQAIRTGTVDIYHHANLNYRWFNPLLATGLTSETPTIVGPVQVGHLIPDDEIRLKLKWLLGESTPDAILDALTTGTKSAKRFLDIPRTTAFEQTLQHADCIVAVSEATKEVYAKHVDAERIEVIPLGVDYDYFSYAPPEERDRATLVTVGRLTYRKGFDVLIDALPAVVESHPDVRLHILGDGPLRDDLESRAVDRGIAKHVRFHGNVPQNEVRNHLQHARAFVHPSRSEGFSHARLEAMATGCPVVGTNVHAAAELTRDGVDGILVPVDDSDAITNGICSILDDGQAAAAMGRRAREHVEQSFDWNDISQSYLNIYRSIAN